MDEDEGYTHESGSGGCFENADGWRFMGMGVRVGLRMGMGMGMGMSVTKPIVCILFPRLTRKVFPFHFPPFHEWFMT